MKYLLDTCSFLWLSQEPDKLSSAASAAVNDSTSALFVSDVSILEITMKHSAGRLPLPEEPRGWVTEKISYHKVQALALTRDVIFRNGELPRTHADPFDRLLAAQAIASDLTIISPDTPLSQLGAARIW